MWGALLWQPPQTNKGGAALTGALGPEHRGLGPGWGRQDDALQVHAPAILPAALGAGEPHWLGGACLLSRDGMEGPRRARAGPSQLGCGPGCACPGKAWPAASRVSIAAGLSAVAAPGTGCTPASEEGRERASLTA